MEMEEPLALPTYQAGMLQSRAYRKLNSFLTNALERWHLTPPQWAALGILCDAQTPLTMQQLANALDVQPSFVARMGHELLTKEFVEQAAGQRDNRVRTIRLTDKGRQLVEQIEPQLRQDMRRFLGSIAQDELALYLSVLGKIAEL